jgi:nitrogen fixation NifU-like protein
VHFARPPATPEHVKYSAIIDDHFANPRNVGEMADANLVGESTNEVCLDKLRLWLRMDGDRVAAVTFRAEGCVPSLAMGSFLTEYLPGHSIEALRGLTPELLDEAVGGLPRTKKHAAHLGFEALQAALAKK